MIRAQGNVQMINSAGPGQQMNPRMQQMQPGQLSLQQMQHFQQMQQAQSKLSRIIINLKQPFYLFELLLMFFCKKIP